ncbi:MAG: flagellar basal body P-ring formation protein FlgA [Colwellia sp.]|nr:flagellar basal body P-ring formation protein FlgA [Colwellia sp.]
MSNIKIFITFLAITTVFSSNTLAEKITKSDIENFAKAYLKAHLDTPTNGKISIKVAKIDPRINLKDCKTNLNANIPENFNGRNVNIKISCADSIPWHIYMAAKVKTMIPVIVAKKSISKGTLLDKTNLTITYIDTYKIRGTFLDDLNKVAGSKAKKKITKNHLITLKNTCSVCKGSSVSITAKSAIFTIKTNGEALSSGNIGDQVRVKNKQSGKIITAQVNAINKVVINL